MKSIIILVGCALFCTSAAFSQKISEDKVPAPVKSAFAAKFKDAKNTKWEMEKTEYEVVFQFNNSSMSANFSKEGTWLETETGIAKDRIPAAVSQTLAKEFPGYRVNEADKLERPGKPTVIEVEVSRGKETMDLEFNEQGKLLKKSNAGND